MANQIVIGDIRGKVGDRGATGNTPNIDVAVNPLPSGSTPTVTIEKTGTHTKDDPLITFGIPVLGSGYVVVFNANSNNTRASTIADFNEIYPLAVNRDNVRFFLVAGDGVSYELSYAVDEINGNIRFFNKEKDISIAFKWTADDVEDFMFKTNTLADIVYSVISTF